VYDLPNGFVSSDLSDR